MSTSPINIKPVLAAAEIAEAVCALPAVATFDWCDAAASCLARLSDPSWRCVSIVTLDPSGSVRMCEATGAGGGPTAAAQPGPRARPTPEQQQNADARLETLRKRAERLVSLGFVPDMGAIAQGFAAPAAQVLRGDWRTSAMGKMWAGIESSDLLVGMIALDNGEPARVLLVQVAPSAAGTTVTDEQAAILRAVLPIFKHKAVMAFGAGPSDQGQWLTAREQLILEELALGKSVKQIADEIDRSPHTVHDHVKSLHRKLNASSRGELIARALGHLPQGARIRDRYRAAQATGRREQTARQNDSAA
jgi:DNA-binding CsgD family transcriptional regulator